ncbi:cyclic AMP-dependent transcription factor ATF-4-like isoform X2 [Limulus polyphemus]|nr:cyclic AMP-dependent transcription factor ATF-4-like isoform X2 [Limulus polyphemus]
MNADLDLSVLEDLEIPMLLSTPDPTTVYPGASDMNIQPTQDFSCIKPTIDEFGLLEETPPDSLDGQVSEIYQKKLFTQEPYHLDTYGNFITLPSSASSSPWNSSSLCSSGTSSPSPSDIQPNILSISQFSYNHGPKPNANEILKAILPQETYNYEEYNLNVSDSSQLLGCIQNPSINTGSFFGCPGINVSGGNIYPGTNTSSSVVNFNPPSITQRRRAKNKHKQREEINKTTLNDSVNKYRKKLQNKEAAVRYRIKKREEAQWMQDEENVLIRKNIVLKDKVQKLENEISYLKSLTKEIVRVKGVLLEPRDHPSCS